MKILYARVSSKEQNLDLQLEAGRRAGCEKVYQEKRSAKNRDRPEFLRMLEILRPGDVVVVYKLDRLARSTPDLVNLIDYFSKKEVGLISLSESWADTTTPQGRLMITIAAGLAQFEREVIAERQRAGIEEARRQGKHLGRISKLDKDQKELVRVLYTGGKSALEISRMYKVSKMTIFRIINEGKDKS